MYNSINSARQGHTRVCVRVCGCGMCFCHVTHSEGVSERESERAACWSKFNTILITVTWAHTKLSPGLHNTLIELPKLVCRYAGAVGQHPAQDDGECSDANFDYQCTAAAAARHVASSGARLQWAKGMGEHLLEHWMDCSSSHRLGDALHADVLLLLSVRVERQIRCRFSRCCSDHMLWQHLPHLLWRFLAGRWRQYRGLSVPLSQHQ